jgi:hypothetical protein
VRAAARGVAVRVAVKVAVTVGEMAEAATVVVSEVGTEAD